MDPNEQRIEIFAPFGEAFETTRKILFQPFDLTKWLVIGFAAWLATLFGGISFNYRHNFGSGDWNWKSHTHGAPFSVHDLPSWVMPLLIGGGILLFAIAILLLWLNSRGRFIFTDCIVRNRGAIAEPWREFRVEGNRYFLLQLVITICSMIIFGGLALIYLLGWHWHHPLLPLPLLILLGVAFFLIAVVVGLIMKFVVPVMYRQRCTAIQAFRAVGQLIAAHPGVFILFGLFYIVLLVAAMMIGCIAACVTCCIAALPYVGTVILLPLVMFLFAYPLCFIRQFGASYDVWAVVRPAELPPLPPIQETPPPPL